MKRIMEPWQIGDVKVTRVIEIQVTGGTKFILPDATRENVVDIDWLAPHFMDPDGRYLTRCHDMGLDDAPRYGVAPARLEQPAAWETGP